MKLPKTLPKQYTKLAAASTLENIGKQIARFYGGEEKELRPMDGSNILTVHSKLDGRKLSTVVVETARGFYFCAALN